MTLPERLAKMEGHSREVDARSAKGTPMSLTDKVAALTEPSNAIDIEIEIALFQPDDRHVSVRPNSAGTKVVYTRRDGTKDTFWAYDYTLTTESRAKALAALQALEADRP